MKGGWIWSRCEGESGGGQLPSCRTQNCGHRLVLKKNIEGGVTRIAADRNCNPPSGGKGVWMEGVRRIE